MANKVGNAASGALSGAAAGSALGPVGAIAGGALGFVGGLFGGGPSEQEKAAAEAVRALEQQYKIAPEEARKIVLQRYQDIGALTPEMEQAILAEPSAYEQVTVDPRFRKTQLEALARLEQKVNQGGLDLEDRAALAEIQRQEAQAARGREQAILQNMAQRGMGGAGAELAARLASSQASADQAAQRGLNVAAQAQKRAAENIQQIANQARAMSSDELARAESLAAARDATQRFNVGQRSNVQQRNVAASNRAGELTFTNKQDIANKNTAIAQEQARLDRDAKLDYIDAQNKKLVDVLKAKSGQAASIDAGNKARSEGLQSTLTNTGALLKEGSKEGGMFTKDFWKKM